ncbi:MAG: DUF1360 domain-containing protein [Ignavibacteria bacterium]|nr:DUF1360 domain-containing protein [Ignavibacteria bacterium]
MLLHIEFNNWYWLGLAILCVWRLTSLICYEDGPFNLFVWLRKKLYQMKLGKLVECFHCMGVWISAIIVLIIFQPAEGTPLIVLSVAGAVSIIERFISN